MASIVDRAVRRRRVLGELLRREVANPRPSEWLGIARLAAETFARRAVLNRPPLHLQIEPTSRCNLACRMCEHSTFSGSGVDLSLAAFLGIVDRLPGLRSVDLTGIGEPLLNHDFEAILRAAKESHLRVRFNTNAVLLDRRWASLLVDLGVDEVHVSIDGATEATFERLRVGAKWANVVSNVRTLAATRRARAPFLSAQMVILPENLREFAALVDLARDIGIDAVSFQGRLGDSENPLVTNREVVMRELALARDHARRHDIAFTAPARRNGKATCILPWTQAFIQVDSTVLPCCLYTQRGQRGEIATRFGMGRVDERPLGEIWNTPAFQELRTNLARGRLDGPCATCPLPRGLY